MRTQAAEPETWRAVRVEVAGTVQGVGFRPFVYRLATNLNLGGDVRNAGGRVVILLRGRPDAIDAFLSRLGEQSPRESRIDRVAVTELGAGEVPPGAFMVATSSHESTGSRAVPPDLATCEACRRELFYPTDRRYRYPFLNCTDCGPRATIVGGLPYDRRRTAMSRFPMCARCAEEYHDPANRRFHAEPTACPACGPELTWSPTGATGPAALAEAEAVIAGGGLVSIKGIGGYQLLCAADAPLAVLRLRAAKHRPRKPFA